VTVLQALWLCPLLWVGRPRLSSSCLHGQDVNGPSRPCQPRAPNKNECELCASNQSGGEISKPGRGLVVTHPIRHPCCGKYGPIQQRPASDYRASVDRAPERGGRSKNTRRDSRGCRAGHEGDRRKTRQESVRSSQDNGLARGRLDRHHPWCVRLLGIEVLHARASSRSLAETTQNDSTRVGGRTTRTATT